MWNYKNEPLLRDRDPEFTLQHNEFPASNQRGKETIYGHKVVKAVDDQQSTCVHLYHCIPQKCLMRSS